MLARRSFLIILIASAFASATAQRPLNPPNYFAFQLPRLIAGEPLVGQLDSSDGQNFKDGSYLDLYAFDGQEGERLALHVSSGEFDPYLSVYAPSGSLVASNDDYGVGTDAGVDLLLPESGRYLVVVSGYSQLAVGSYTVELSSGVGVSEARSRELAIPGVLLSTITEDMPTLPDSYIGNTEYFSLSVPTTTFLVITMTSWDVDAVLTLYDEYGGLVDQNDDYGMGSDARLALELAPGHYTLAASSYFTGWTGDYTLEVKRYIEGD